mmetsp:Transcript_68414/g.216433  ORF Transcript_68414/g.216433 Transcript_68414/m.216433 type:complete len:220 (+) Transcript_68414:636-1295(+)
MADLREHIAERPGRSEAEVPRDGGHAGPHGSPEASCEPVPVGTAKERLRPRPQEAQRKRQIAGDTGLEVLIAAVPDAAVGALDDNAAAGGKAGEPIRAGVLQLMAVRPGTEVLEGDGDAVVPQLLRDSAHLLRMLREVLLQCSGCSHEDGLRELMPEGCVPVREHRGEGELGGVDLQDPSHGTAVTVTRCKLQVDVECGRRGGCHCETRNARPQHRKAT